jgi:hypothetical protein
VEFNGNSELSLNEVTRKNRKAMAIGSSGLNGSIAWTKMSLVSPPTQEEE